MHLIVFLNEIWIQIVLATFLTLLLLSVYRILCIVRITQHRTYYNILYPKLLELERLSCPIRKISFLLFIYQALSKG